MSGKRPGSQASALLVAIGQYDNRGWHMIVGPGP